MTIVQSPASPVSLEEEHCLTFSVIDFSNANSATIDQFSGKLVVGPAVVTSYVNCKETCTPSWDDGYPMITTTTCVQGCEACVSTGDKGKVISGAFIHFQIGDGGIIDYAKFKAQVQTCRDLNPTDRVAFARCILGFVSPTGEDGTFENNIDYFIEGTKNNIIDGKKNRDFRETIWLKPLPFGKPVY